MTATATKPKRTRVQISRRHVGNLQLRLHAPNARLWQSPARLAALLIRWRYSRFAGDERAFDAAEAWRKHDKHLWTWQANQRRKFFAWRKDLYLNFCARLRREYQTLRIAKVDWAKLRLTPPPEAGDDIPHRYRNVASVGMLDTLLRNHLAVAERIDPENLSDTCHACGKLSGLNGESVRHTCRHCEATWDQDENHCRNLLRERRGAEPPIPAVWPR